MVHRYLIREFAGVKIVGDQMYIFFFWGGALESDIMRGCCEEGWALQLLPRKLTA